MSTEAALLRAIRERPDEDTPRLIYADVLDEEGYSPLAEFIRVQIERARLPEHDTQRAPLEDREHGLLGTHECAWLGVEPSDADEMHEWVFERGFVEEVAASPVFMNGPGGDLCAAHPVRRWRVMSGQNNFPEDLREAGQRAWCSRIEALDLSGWYSGLGELSGFLKRSHFNRLRELDLLGLTPLEPLAEILEETPFRSRLKVLRCGGGRFDAENRLEVSNFARALGRDCRLDELSIPFTSLTAAELRELLAAGCCESLTSLSVRDNEIAPDGWDAFDHAHCRLRELDISHTPLGAIALDRLLNCNSLASLRRLHLNGCGSAMSNLRALAASRFWTAAESLRMQHGTIPHLSLDPLFEAAGSPALRVFDVGGNYLRDEGVAKLCEAPWAGTLAYLDLSQNYLTDAALRTMARCGRFQNLRTLHLNFNSVYHQDGAEPDESITDAGLRSLAESTDLARLRILSVSGTRITSAGVEAVLNGPHWSLTGLNVAQCQLRPNVVELLAQSPRLARLELLDLSLNDEIAIDDLAPLAESEYLSPQTELNIRGISGNSAVRAALRQRLGPRLSEV